MPLPTISLPLPANGPPFGYDWKDRAMSTTTSFDTALSNRDRFLGKRRCVVCGIGISLDQCHIIMQSEEATWTDLQDRNWVFSKESPAHEPRNGLTLCVNHHIAFDQYYFFIRFMPEIRMYIFVNYSGLSDLQEFHGRVIAIDSDDDHAPFPSLFMIHEMRVRGFHPFQPVQPDIPNLDMLRFADWIDTEDLWDYEKNTFKRQRPLREGGHKKQKHNVQAQAPKLGFKLEALNSKVVTDILAATHTMPAWGENSGRKYCFFEWS